MSRKSHGFITLSREGKQRELQSMVESKEKRRLEFRRSRRAIVLLGAMIIAVCCVGAIAAWRANRTTAGSLNASPASASLAMPLAPPPALPANAPSKEFIYAGSALLATNEPFREPPVDYAVWRPGNSTWYVINSQNQWTSQTWGSPGDKPVPGDYDGDGKTDFSVFGNTYWYVSLSAGGTKSESFGLADDKVAPADYDGDGKTDLAVYRPSNAFWYIRQSSTGYLVAAQFGLSTDTPAPGDFDGDGKADLTVLRGSGTGATFYSLKSTDNTITSVPVGDGDKPVIGDYDGDGRADFATRQASSNNWRILYSGSGAVQNITWGSAGDLTVQGDYDRDSKTDVAVWRPSNGVWYVLKSSNNALHYVQWGQNGDTPVPAPYRRF